MRPGLPRVERLRRRVWRRALRAGVRLTLPVKRLQARGVLPSALASDGPDFLIIGAQKAGTTWLSENLDAHPEISMARRDRVSDPTEIRYFDRQLHRSLAWYGRHFRDLPGPIRGEKSPNYYALPPERVRLIGSLLPEARIVLMLRNPVERAWSHALMNLVTLPGRPYESVAPERFVAHFRRTFPRGRYTTALETWWSVYPRERVHVGFFEDLAVRPRALLQETFAFLDAAPETDWEAYPFQKRINRGPGIPPPPPLRAELEALYRDEIERLHGWFGAPVESWRTGAP